MGEAWRFRNVKEEPDAGSAIRGDGSTPTDEAHRALFNDCRADRRRRPIAIAALSTLAAQTR